MPPIDPERFQAGTGLIPKQQGFTPPDDGLGTVDTTLPRFSGLMVGLAGGPTAAPALKVDAGLPEAPPKWKAAIDERYNIAADAARRAKAFQNPAAYDAAVGQIRTIKEDEVLASARADFFGGADQVETAVRYLNKNSGSLSLGPADPKTGMRSLSIVKADGDTLFPKLSRQDQQTLFAASALMDINPERALQMMGAVNKDLAAAVAAENGMVNMVAGTNNTANHQARQDASAAVSAGASATNAKSAKDLRDAQIGVINDQGSRRQESAELAQAYQDLTPEEQNGAKGMAIMRQFNMLNIKDGAQVNLGMPRGSGSGNGGVLKAAVEQKQNDDGSYTAFDKNNGTAMYNTFHGEAFPLGMSVAEYAGEKKRAAEAGVKLVVGEDDGRVVLRFQGADGKFYQDALAAEKAKPEKERPGSGLPARGSSAEGSGGNIGAVVGRAFSPYVPSVPRTESVKSSVLLVDPARRNPDPRFDSPDAQFGLSYSRPR